ncbi:SDR family NAD(P)-dependent oxidoreductase [Catenuloplanes atrovinosus]|uniref:NAD(P)-dependent dehydrogenase (Short-subunit alcohol dehydrogenase family) n=1 Tax=Catenuloplanes atrovinosus TaxID=137266 RepID=A0AAE3YRL7_9ACTN|nr:SDR family NAD(P)-dependent oxidoreductase [Catenuloplanes atrovinosus]MDR7277367.1 NAD(P)-dependent dehydrogenase (short-subunit alcohol dehydrogenase family) [Catenuloplanes atrovinosus]
MTTRTAVITGAAGGLGRATVRRLLDAGLQVIAVTRDGASLPSTRTLHADLTDRDAVRALAARLHDTAGRVDVLINNAGAAFARYAATPDGTERTHALNHLAPFLLTRLLLDGGTLAPGARVINISSDLVGRGRLDAAHPDVTGASWRDRYAQIPAYGTAKLLNLMATTALAARLPDGMTAYSANPGLLRTGFNARSGGALAVAAAVGGLFATAPDRAAAWPVALATAPVAPAAGLYVKGRPAAPPKPARDPDAVTAVYEHTARALGLP